MFSEHDDHTAANLQRQGVPLRDRGGHSPRAGRDPSSSHSYPLWHQKLSASGHMTLEEKHKRLVTQKYSPPFLLSVSSYAYELFKLEVTLNPPNINANGTKG